MARIDWDGAAKRDYARKHGSVPYWEDLPKPRSLQPRPQDMKTGKAIAAKTKARCSSVLKEFRALPQDERAAQAQTYRKRIKELCALERRAVPANRRRFAVVVDQTQNTLLREIKKLSSPAENKNSRPHTKKRTKQQPAPKRKRGLGPVLPKSRRQRSGTAQTPSSKRRLPLLTIEAAFRRGVLYAGWDDHPDADGWRLIVRGSDRRLHRVTALPEQNIATQLEGLPPESAPYDLQVVAMRQRQPVAEGRVKSIGFA